MLKADIYMHPIRQRIIQYLLLHKQGTATDIHSVLSDIPTATLYRHIKVLLDTHCLTIVKETKIRGTVEKTYALEEQPLGKDITHDEIHQLIQSSLIMLLSSFQNYFTQENVDPMQDMLSTASSTLLLSDQEFQELLENVGQLLHHQMHNQPNADRKIRNITFISSPGEEHYKKGEK